MGPTVAIAFGAGLVSALLFASLASGSPLAIIIFYFSALPVLIAGLGWGTYAGAFAAAIGALVLSLVLRPYLGLAYFFSVGLPAWVLVGLALSWWRSPTQAEPERTEWCPPGLLLAAIGAFGVLLTLIGIALLFGLDFDAYRAALREAVTRTLTQMRASRDNVEALAGFMTTALPVMFGIIWTFVTALNLFIAGRVVRASGRLPRPWPDLPSLKLPKWSVLALLFGTLGSFAGGMVGHVAAIVLGVGLAVFALQGFAFVHDTMRGWSMRGFALGMLYALTLVIGWPMIFVALAGLADVLFDLRVRLPRQQPPPPPSPPPWQPPRN